MFVSIIIIKLIINLIS